MSKCGPVLDPNWTQIVTHPFEGRTSEISGRLWPLLDSTADEMGGAPGRPNARPKRSGGRWYLIDDIEPHTGEAQQREWHRTRASKAASDDKYPGCNQ